MRNKLFYKKMSGHSSSLIRGLFLEYNLFRIQLNYINEKHPALDKVFFIFLICSYKPGSVLALSASDRYLSRM